ncbi:MAG: hypothetical protein MJ219_04070 [Mycoplasmoidaceae bacterium]|nr:hypothetical protein [Mycoplasmoidaceae bacterium]
MAISQSLCNKLNSPHNSQTIRNGTKTKTNTDKNIHQVLVLCVALTKNIDWPFIAFKLYNNNIMAETSKARKYFKKCFSKNLLIKKAIIAVAAAILVLSLSLSFYF